MVSGWSIRAKLGVSEEEDLLEALQPRMNEPNVQAVLHQAGEALGILLLNVHHALNPSELVLGGSLTQLGCSLMEPALDYFKAHQNRLASHSQKVPLRIIEDSTFVSARGAAAQVLSHIIHGSSELI